MNNFKEATKNPNVRFNLGNGEVTVCDLWQYGLERLDSLYSSLYQELETSKQVSLLAPKTTSSKLLELKLSVVKEVVETKLADKADKEAKVIRADQARVIREKLAEKRIQSLDTLSEEDLLKQLEDLES